jgi:flagellar basal-body rod protein FlgF
MADGIYIGMSGAEARSEQLDAISDALANVQTPGYRATRPAFATILSQAGGVSYAKAVGAGVDTRSGVLQQTGNPLDVVPQNGAWLAVESPSGDVSYTRDGRMSVGEDGQLHVAGGLVLGENGGPIAIPKDTIATISSDGLVMSNGEILDRLSTHQLQGPLQHVAGSLYTAPDVERVTEGMQVGTLELSNSSALDAAVGMVTAQRGFESSMQVIDTYKTMHDRASELGRVR